MSIFGEKKWVGRGIVQYIQRPPCFLAKMGRSDCDEAYVFRFVEAWWVAPDLPRRAAGRDQLFHSTEKGA